jgi:hypothetical protein
MRVRLISFLLIVLMAIPAGWAAPASFIAHSSHASHAANDAPPCHTEDAQSRDDCPCCPDHGGSMSDCLSACAVALAVPVTSLPVIQAVDGVRPLAHTVPAFTSIEDSPFKPPPIL